MLPSGEWVPVDASIGDQNDRNCKRSFGMRDNRRGELSKSFDVMFPKKQQGRQFVDFLQVGAWW